MELVGRDTGLWVYGKQHGAQVVTSSNLAASTISFKELPSAIVVTRLIDGRKLSLTLLSRLTRMPMIDRWSELNGGRASVRRARVDRDRTRCVLAEGSPRRDHAR